MSEAKKVRPFSRAVQKLRGAGLRPTRQRLALAKILFDGPNCHVTAEILHDQVAQANITISLATIYNSLHQFTNAGLLREVIVDSSRTYFDTNISDHHHYYLEEEGCLIDIPDGAINFDMLPDVPKGKKFSRLEAIIYITEV